ncbi:hypothetical protein ABZ532_30970 [Streptomyces sp. NPDC019396]|uniref:hypothetical protein n=1 Tax=Streptomyces sp. NPDC019396 TaxID=3154687 RepID=UPI0033E3F8D7
MSQSGSKPDLTEADASDREAVQGDPDVSEPLAAGLVSGGRQAPAFKGPEDATASSIEQAAGGAGCRSGADLLLHRIASMRAPIPQGHQAR